MRMPLVFPVGGLLGNPWRSVICVTAGADYPQPRIFLKPSSVIWEACLAASCYPKHLFCSHENDISLHCYSILECRISLISLIVTPCARNLSATSSSELTAF